MGDPRRRAVPVLLLASLLVTGVAHADDAGIASASAAVAAGGRHPWLTRPDLDDVAAEIRALHPPGRAGPLWLRGGRPGPVMAGVVRVISAADLLGLDPAGFDADRLAAALREVGAAPMDDRDLALLDVAVTVQWMRLLSAAHGGVIEAPRAGRGADLPDRRLDLERLVRETAGGADPAAVLASVEPRYPNYARLKVALAGQRALAASPPAPEVPAPGKPGKVSPGDTWEGTPALRARLVALGDLAAGSAPPADPARLDPELVAGLRRFQARHALAVDGVVGKETVLALNVPAAARVRQIELALERWRWLPDPERRVVVVEIPRAELQALDVVRGTTEVAMRTVVGASRSNETPMLAASISTVVFRPYWVPPPRILRQEILPRAREAPDWLAEHGMEIVARPEEEAETYPPTEDVLDRVEQGELTLRQRPGPRNDLGAVKFVLPDAQCIALHGTPHGRLFDLPHRERSHGCIRLQDPGALARWVLRGEPGWDDARIAEAAARERSTSVRLREPVPVVFVYGTAAVDPDGTLVFVDDAYRLDARAEAELARRRAGAGD